MGNFVILILFCICEQIFVKFVEVCLYILNEQTCRLYHFNGEVTYLLLWCVILFHDHCLFVLVASINIFIHRMAYVYYNNSFPHKYQLNYLDCYCYHYLYHYILHLIYLFKICLEIREERSYQPCHNLNPKLLHITACHSIISSIIMSYL